MFFNIFKKNTNKFKVGDEVIIISLEEIKTTSPCLILKTKKNNYLVSWKLSDDIVITPWLHESQLEFYNKKDLRDFKLKKLDI